MNCTFYATRRKTRLAATALGLVLGLAASPAAQAAWRGTTVKSPNSAVRMVVVVRNGRLQYSVSLRGDTVVEPSPIGLTVDGVDLGEGVEAGKVRKYKVDQTYATRGVHALAVDRCRGEQIALRHSQSGTAYTLEVRAGDSGVAFRLLVPGAASASRVPDEATAFTLPAGSTVWYHGFRGHYEGRHTRKDAAAVEPGEWAAPPLTYQLPGNKGYASITEADLVNFSGMGLQADGHNVFRARLGHAQPPSYPYVLRYGEAEAARLSAPAAIAGDITTPWRVVLVGPDLNTLVNSDLIAGLNPAPDPKLFPDGLAAGWLKPGRAVWKYLDDSRQNSPELAREYTDMAHDLGFEYQVVEGYWSRWPQQTLKEFMDYSRSRGVGVFLWKHSRDLHDPTARHQFLQMCHDLGVAGIKIDFFDHEAKELIDFYQVLLRETAEQHLLVNFHGANKPTGESRTWPNQLTREAVAGMESRGARAQHDATVPFTRFLAGAADYTPVVFSAARRGDTTWAHQIATAVVFTSPLLTYGANTRSLLDNPAAEMIQAIPSVWDETVVLPPSQIGEVALFARRSGSTWFLAAVNGPAERTLTVPLAFLPSGPWHAQLVRDGSADDAVAVEGGEHTASDSLTIVLRPGGGFVGRLWK